MAKRTAVVFKYEASQPHWNIQMDGFETEFEGREGLPFAVAELAAVVGIDPEEIEVSHCEEWDK